MVSKTQQRPGRPADYVKDKDGKPIVGMSLHKSSGRYYATHSKPRVYFGKDYPVALIEFREWEAKEIGATTTFTEEVDEIEVNKWVYPPKKTKTGKKREVRTTIPEDVYIARLRADLSDPASLKLLAEKTGFVYAPGGIIWRSFVWWSFSSALVWVSRSNALQSV